MYDASFILTDALMLEKGHSIWNGR